MIPNKGRSPDIKGHCECRCNAFEKYGPMPNLLRELRSLADIGYKTEDHDYCMGMAAMEKILDRYEGVSNGEQ